MGGLLLVLLIRFPIHFVLYPPYLMDFDVFRMVAERVAHGQSALLYHPTTSAVMMFKYAPCWAVLLLPLAWVPAQVAAILWTTLTVLWVGVAGLLIVKLCRLVELDPPPWLLVAVVSVLVRPITAEFLNGQIDVLWALLVISFVWADAHQQPWSAALWLSLAISLKLPSAIFLVGIIARGRLQPLLRTLTLLVGLNVAATILLQPFHPWSLFRDWAAVLWSSGTSRAYEIGNQTLLALMARFFSANAYHINLLALPPHAIPLLTTLVFIGLVAVAIMPGDRVASLERQRIFDGAFLTVLMVLGSPTAWIATYSALLLPMAIAVCGLRRLHQVRWDLSSLLLGVLLVALSAMTHATLWRRLGVTSIRGETYIYLVLMILPWLGLVLFASLWRQRQLLAAVASGISDS